MCELNGVKAVFLSVSSLVAVAVLPCLSSRDLVAVLPRVN